jgi:hypothetical protein
VTDPTFGLRGNAESTVLAFVRLLFPSPPAWADKNLSKLPSFNCPKGEKVLRSLVCVSDKASKAKERNDGIMDEVLAELQ